MNELGNFIPLIVLKLFLNFVSLSVSVVTIGGFIILFEFCLATVRSALTIVAKEFAYETPG